MAKRGQLARSSQVTSDLTSRRWLEFKNGRITGHQLSEIGPFKDDLTPNNFAIRVNPFTLVNRASSYSFPKRPA
jgi:hypothetical protein